MPGSTRRHGPPSWHRRATVGPGTPRPTSAATGITRSRAERRNASGSFGPTSTSHGPDGDLPVVIHGAVRRTRVAKAAFGALNALKAAFATSGRGRRAAGGAQANVCQRSTAFRAMITAAASAATAVVEPPVHQLAHQPAAAGEQHQRHQRERDAERQHHLREHQRRGRVDAQREHHERGRQGQRAAREQRDPPPHEALHHHLARVGPHARRREPGRQQGQREQRSPPGRRAPGQPGVHALERVRVRDRPTRGTAPPRRPAWPR